MAQPSAIGHNNLTKLTFTVVYCSSFDDDYHYKGLEHHGPQTRGWQSKRLAPMPQRLVLDFGQEVEVGKLQVLSHQSKIASTIDLYADSSLAHAPPEEALNAANFQRLGYISLNSNEETGYQARELKTVYLQTRLRFLQLVIPGVHANNVNVFKQVGIVAINVLGRFINQTPSVPGSLSAHPNASDAQSGPSNYGSPQISGVMPVFAPPRAPPAQPLQVPNGPVAERLYAEILRLQKLKEDAVAIEDYDEAKRFKIAGDRLRAISSEIAHLETEKRICVENDDFDGAKASKLRLDRLYADALRDPEEVPVAYPMSSNNNQPQSQDSSTPKGYFPRQLHAQQQPVLSHASPANYSNPNNAFSPEDRPIKGVAATDVRRGSSGGAAVITHSESLDHSVIDDSPYEAIASQPRNISATSGPAPGFSSALDEIPVGGSRMKRGAFSAAEEEILANSQLGGGVGSAAATAGEAEELTAVELKEAEQLIEAFGMAIVRMLYSKQPGNRQAGLKQIQEMIVGQQAPLLGVTRSVDAASGLAAVCRAVKTALDDTPVVALAGLQVLEAAVPCFSASSEGLSGAVLTQNLEPTVPLLLKQSAGNNARSRSAAHDMLVLFTRHRAVDPSIVTTHALRPLQKRDADKPLVLKGRAQLLLDILPRLGFVEGVKKQGQVQLAPVLKFALPCLQFRDAQVREVASRVVALSVEACGERTVKPYLKDLPPQSKELVASAITAAGGAPSSDQDVPASSGPSSTPVAPSSAPVVANRVTPGPHSRNAGVAKSPRGQNVAAASSTASKSTASANPGSSTKPSRDVASKTSPRAAATPTIKVAAPSQPASADAPFNSAPSRDADMDQFDDVDPDGLAAEGNYCNFCGLEDENLSINKHRDDHYCVACPGLVLCVGCNQVVEIPTLPEHLETECEERDKPNVIALRLDCAKKMSAALTSAPLHLRESALSCPLCYELVANTAAGAKPDSSEADYDAACRAWQAHFAQKPYCKANPRTQGWK